LRIDFQNKYILKIKNMKKKLLSLIGLTSLSLIAGAQSISSMSPQDYQTKKEKGLLQHVEINTQQPKVKSNTQKSNNPSPIITDAPAGCGCLMTLDSTFSYVPFAQGGGSIGVAPYFFNDDGSTISMPLPFGFNFYGDTMHNVFINNNGNISFSGPYSIFTAYSFPNNAFNMIAPFWSDVDTRGVIYDTINGQLVPQGKVMYKMTPTALIVKWENVGYFSMQNDKLNTFQLIITDGNDPLVPGGNNVSFCYGDMQWTTGSASGGINGFGGSPSTVGINKGDAINYFQITQNDHDSTDYDGGYNNPDGVSYLDNKSFYFNTNTGAGMNIPPIELSDLCDTLTFAPGDSTDQVVISFAGPEINDMVTLQLAPNPDASVISNTTGDYAVMVVQVNATSKKSNNNTLVVTATDSYNNVTTQTLHVAPYVPPVLTEVQKINNSEMNITPNPSNGKFFVSNAHASAIKVMDMLGATVVDVKVNNQAITELDLSNYPNGVYFVQFIAGKEMLTKKIVKN
jgi:hypothetical protein